KGEDHQAPTHEAGNGIILVQGVLDPGNDLPGHVSGLVGEGDHVMVIIFRIAATVPPLLPAPGLNPALRGAFPTPMIDQCPRPQKLNRLPKGSGSGAFTTRPSRLT